MLVPWQIIKEARRTPLTLRYAPEAAAEVRTLMAQGQKCCPFLTFGKSRMRRRC